MPPFATSILSLLLLQLQLWPVSAKPGRRPHYAMDDNNNIVNNYNDRYTVNLTVGGTPVNVMLDTGSTDAWVAPLDEITGSFKNTGASASIFYGDGSNFVNGTVLTGQVEIAGITIPHQAFINVTNSVGEESDVAQGIFGLVGLGFDGPNGDIPSALTAAGYNGTDVGKAILTSIFAQSPDKGNFFSFSLSRVGDVHDSADASLVISGYDPKYTAVQSSPQLPQFPVGGGRWSVVTDGISVGGKDVEWEAYGSPVPKGQTVVLFDTGTTNFLVPPEVRDQIYSSVPGAVLAKNSSIPNLKFSEDNDVWVIPCTTPVNMTTKFGGQIIPIHPLDLSDMVHLKGPDGKQYTACIGSITNGGSILGRNLDALYGDSFLRNVYSVFSFGDDKTLPNVQLLANTETIEAASDFFVVRGELLENSPPELAPEDIIKLFDGPSSVSSSSSSSSTSTSSGSTDSSTNSNSGSQANSDSSTPSSGGSLPECTVPAGSDALSNGPNSKSSVNLADNGSSSSSTSDKYGPVIVGLLAANLVLLLLVASLSVVNFVRGGRTTGSTRNPSYVPVKLKEDGPRSSFSMTAHTGYSD
ncbi:Six-hairpin glycosidase [Favolaschia claudopus]|uniref:Six-hairpin glycosidase n=1 Tax=Favolaschia claudopus TaxID=2862362 RepID=A0AAW0CAF8_9AGAR